jgi:hypothetical protein
MINYVDMNFVSGSSLEIPEEVSLDGGLNMKIGFLCTNKVIGNPSNNLEKDSRENLNM